MNVSKIFMTLIIVVACVLIGALVLNVLLPNITTALVDITEDAIMGATGISFDFNGNGKAGTEDGKVGDMVDDATSREANGRVAGKASVQKAN